MFYSAHLFRFYVFISLFGDTIRFCDSDGLLCRNSVLDTSITFFLICVCVQNLQVCF